MCYFLLFPGRLPGGGVDLMGVGKEIMGSIKLSEAGAISGSRFSATHRKRLTGCRVDEWSVGRSWRRAPGSHHPPLSSSLTVALRPLSSVPRAGLHDLP